MSRILPIARHPSSPIAIQRLPSFRNFQLPDISLSKFASSRTLNNVYKTGDETERQTLNNVDEESLKWETEYNAEAEEDPNLVSPVISPTSNQKLTIINRSHGTEMMIQKIRRTGQIVSAGQRLYWLRLSHLFRRWRRRWLHHH